AARLGGGLVRARLGRARAQRSCRRPALSGACVRVGPGQHPIGCCPRRARRAARRERSCLAARLAALVVLHCAQYFHAYSDRNFCSAYLSRDLASEVFLPLVDDAEAGKAVYSRRNPIVVREIAGEHLLVPVRRKVGEMRAIYALMGSAAPIFELLDGSRS